MPAPINPNPIRPVVPATPTISAATVREAEKLLKLAGFNPGAVDGQSSPALTKALSAFQEAWGLPKSGLADVRTMEKLRHTRDRTREHKGDGYFSVGQQSGEVKTIEKRLQLLGYDVGKADGVYSKQTFAAVKAFKADQADIKNDSGAIAKYGRSVLAREVAALKHAPERRRMDPSKAQDRLDARTTKAAARGFGEGARGFSVGNVQRHLRAAVGSLRLVVEEHRVVGWQDRAAGITEDRGRAFIRQDLHDDLRAGHRTTGERMRRGCGLGRGRVHGGARSGRTS